MITTIRPIALRSIAASALLCAMTAGWPALIPSASASDLPVKAPGAVAAPLWNGYYFGVHGGGAWGSSHIDDAQLNPTLSPGEIKSDGIIAGAQVGANWQFGHVVFGAELDGSWASLRGNYVTTPSDIISASNTGSHIQALATGTVRAGYAVGPWLAYVKAGGAYANMKLSTGNLGPEVVTYDQNRFGATAGAGFEVALFRNVSAKVEYNFLYFPETSVAFVNPNTTSHIDQYVHLVKAGFNVHFGGGDTVVARY